MPEHTPYIAGNWKMWGTRAQAADYCERLLGLLPGDGAEVGLCVPFTSLEVCVQRLRGSGVRVAAQTMHHDRDGAYTGEVSAPMLAELGVDAVVLGHSERRQYNCETDRALQEKVPAALAAGLEPILCVGESEEEREADETQRKLRHQVKEALAQVPDERLADVTIAYEPIWAIGTGKVATPEQAQEAVAFVRALIAGFDGDEAEQARILYGGSFKPENAQELLALPDVDGALVGGASLDPADFGAIVEIAARG
jgi:triosephosphate isomerase (TIM)